MVENSQFFETLPERFKPDRAQGLAATFRFDLAGEDGGVWTVRVADGACEVHKGELPGDPDLVVRSSAHDFDQMTSGSLNPQVAFMTGRLKVDGDMGLAMRLQSVFF